MGVSSIMIPLQVGVDLDLTVLAAELGVGPTVTFTTSVGDNDFEIVKDELNGTRFGGLLSAKLKVAFLTGWLGYQFDVTDAFEDGGFSSGNINQWMFGLGINF